jgi:hypothetical protein
MGNRNYTVCDAHYFDIGGPSAHYTENENSTITFTPAEPTKKLSAIFNSMDIEEGGADCSNDKLLVFDGTSATSTLLATLCGSTIPQTIMASDPAGALTFQFISNSSNSASGWDITLTCDSNVGFAENIAAGFRIYPNPVSDGNTFIESNDLIQALIVRDVTGKILVNSYPLTKQVMLKSDWPSGIYLIQMQIQGKWVSKKLQVLNH